MVFFFFFEIISEKFFWLHNLIEVKATFSQKYFPGYETKLHWYWGSNSGALTDMECCFIAIKPMFQSDLKS